MRVGKKPNVIEVKKTRSCVVRLEKVIKDSTSPSPVSLEDSSLRVTRSNRLSVTVMGATPKGRRTGVSSTQQEDKPQRGPIKKRLSNLSTLQQQQKTSSSNISHVRTTQKIKAIPRTSKSTPASSPPSRDETPPPTIAAGRSRRAIKPNPKYASEDLVTPKVLRNVASSSTNRGGGSSSSAFAGSDANKARRGSTSSDDFYNHDSEDDYENEMNDLDEDDDDDNDMHNDKAYKANEKEQDDSDFSEIEEQPVKPTRPRGRPRRVQDPTLVTQTPSSSVKRTTTTPSGTGNQANLRTAPSQLQQMRRSLANANAQRNVHLLAGSGSGIGQKRKLEESQDSSDNETYNIKRKQLILSNSTGVKVKVPVRDNKINTSTTLVKSRTIAMQKTSATNSGSSTTFGHNTQQKQQALNGTNKVSNSQQMSRRAIEIGIKSNSSELASKIIANQVNRAQSNSMGAGQQSNFTNQAKMFASKNTRLRSNSPKPANLKDKQSSPGITASVAVSNANKTTKTDKSSSSTSMANLRGKSSVSSLNKTIEVKDDSHNSTIDDFETMPTFTIVNVNDIINKKGDVLITKSNTNTKAPSVIEFSESIDLDEDDGEEDIEEIRVPSPSVLAQQSVKKRLPKLAANTVGNRKELENKKSSLARSNEGLRKLPTHAHANNNAISSSKQAPQILNHKLGLRNSRVTAKATTTLTATLKPQDKPAPRILNSMVAKKTQPVKPMIANMEDSADESFPLSLDEDEDDEEAETEDEVESRKKNRVLVSDKEGKELKQQHTMDIDTEDTESQNTEEDDVVLPTSNYTNSKNSALNSKQKVIQQRKKRITGVYNTPIVVSNNKKKLTTATAASTTTNTTSAASKENSLAATNHQQATDNKQQPISPALPRKTNVEKVVISKQGDKIIKKITCYETWYVINMPMEIKRPAVMKNQLEMPLIRLANNSKTIVLPTDLWSSKVTLYELSPHSLGKSTFVTYTGDLHEHNISEEDRGKYQPSCVMFRRSIEKNQFSRMPYDRAVIFKNKTFYTNIEGKNVRLVGAPSIINSENEVEILLEIVDALTLQSEFVEHISIVQ